MNWKSSVPIVILLIVALLTASWPAALHAQAEQPLFCDSLELSQSDCELLAGSRAAMADLQAAASEITVEFELSNVPEMPFDTVWFTLGQDLTYSLSDEAALTRAELRELAQTGTALSQESLEELVRRLGLLLEGTDFDSTTVLGLSEELVAMIQAAAEEDGEPLPFELPGELTLSIRKAGTIIYVNISPFANLVPDVTAVGDIWLGVDFGSMLELALDEAVVSADLATMDADAQHALVQVISASLAGISGPVVTSLAVSPVASTTLPFLNVERLEDTTIDERAAAVFRTSVDYDALLSDQRVQELLLDVLAEEGLASQEPTEAEMDDIMALIELFGPSILETIVFDVIERIDLQTGMLVDSELTLSWEIDKLAPLLGMAGDLGLPPGEELPALSLVARAAYRTDLPSPAVAQPETALIVGAETLLNLFESEPEVAPLAPVAPEAPRQASDPAALFDEAVALSVAGDYAAAVALFDQAIAGDPINAEYYTERARTHYFAGDFELALADFDAAIQLEPAAVRYNGRGATYEELGLVDEAIDDYERAIEVDPEFAMAHYNLALFYARQGDYEQAIAGYDAALEADPTNVTTHIARGNVFYSLGEYEQAIANYDMALELDPAMMVAYIDRGDAYAALEQYEQALLDYDTGIELDPDFARSYNNRGYSYQNLEEYEQAIADYSRAVELDPGYIFAYINRGDTHHILGEYERAIEDFDAAIALDPNNAYPYFARGLAFYALDDIEQEIAEYTKAIEIAPDYALAYYYRGLSYEDLGEYELALADYSTVIELEPNNVSALYDRGLLHGTMEEYKLALNDFDEVLLLAPNTVRAFRERGYIHEAMGRVDRAIADLSRYLELAPDAEDRDDVEATLEGLR